MTMPTAPVRRRLVGLEGLRQMGITKHRISVHRDVRAGKFPAPVKIGSRNFWLVDEIEAWLAERVAERDARARAVAEARGGPAAEAGR